MNQLKIGAILNYIVIFLNTFVGLLYTPYMLKMMGQSEYGLYSLVASVIGYLTVLDLGLGNAIVRYTAKLRAEGNVKEQYEMFGMFFILYLILSIIALIGGLYLYYNINFMFGDTMTVVELEHARTMMLILVFNLVFTFPMSIFGSIITAYERFVFPKVVNIVRVLLNTLIMIVLLHMGYKATAMVVLQTIFNVISLLLNFWYCKRSLHIEMHFIKFKLDFLREVAIYSFWIFLNVIMDKIYWSSGQFILGTVSGTIAISIFAVAIQLQGMYMQFSTAISSVFLPKVTGMVALNNSNKDISDLFIRTGRIQNIVMSIILFGFIVFGKSFVLLWAGHEYIDSYPITVLFFISLYVPLIQNLGITILQARNQMKFRSVLYIIIASIALILQYYLAKKWGGFGCAIAISAALLLGQGLILNIYYEIVQKLEIVKFWKEILRMNIIPLLISFVSLSILYFVKLSSWLHLVVAIFVYVLVYCPLYYKYSMNDSERKLIANPFKSFFR